MWSCSLVSSQVPAPPDVSRPTQRHCAHGVLHSARDGVTFTWPLQVQACSGGTHAWALPPQTAIDLAGE